VLAVAGEERGAGKWLVGSGARWLDRGLGGTGAQGLGSIARWLMEEGDTKEAKEGEEEEEGLAGLAVLAVLEGS